MKTLLQHKNNFHCLYYYYFISEVQWKYRQYQIELKVGLFDLVSQTSSLINVGWLRNVQIAIEWVQDYQFWSEADCSGDFSINNVRAGEYNLFAWVPGFIGDYRYHVPITITPGFNQKTKFIRLLTVFWNHSSDQWHFVLTCRLWY